MKTRIDLYFRRMDEQLELSRSVISRNTKTSSFQSEMVLSKLDSQSNRIFGWCKCFKALSVLFLGEENEIQGNLASALVGELKRKTSKKGDMTSICKMFTAADDTRCRTLPERLFRRSTRPDYSVGLGRELADADLNVFEVLSNGELREISCEEMREWAIEIRNQIKEVPAEDTNVEIGKPVPQVARATSTSPRSWIPHAVKWAAAACLAAILIPWGAINSEFNAKSGSSANFGDVEQTEHRLIDLAEGQYSRGEYTDAFTTIQTLLNVNPKLNRVVIQWIQRICNERKESTPASSTNEERKKIERILNTLSPPSEQRSQGSIPTHIRGTWEDLGSYDSDRLLMAEGLQYGGAENSRNAKETPANDGSAIRTFDYDSGALVNDTYAFQDFAIGTKGIYESDLVLNSVELVNLYSDIDDIPSPRSNYQILSTNEENSETSTQANEIMGLSTRKRSFSISGYQFSVAITAAHTIQENIELSWNGLDANRRSEPQLSSDPTPIGYQAATVFRELALNSDELSSPGQPITQLPLLELFNDSLQYEISGGFQSRLRPKGMIRKSATPDYRQKKTIVTIGNNTYSGSSGFANLIAPENDTRLVNSRFRRMGYSSIPISGPQATKANILTTLTHQADSSNPGDILVVYYSGHGVSDKTNQAIVAVNADNSSSLVTVQELLAALTQYNGNVVLILDSCNERVNGDLSKFAFTGQGNPLGSVIMLAAAQDGQQAFESKRSGTSVFTSALVMALDELADSEIFLDRPSAFTDLFVKTEIHMEDLGLTKLQSPSLKGYRKPTSASYTTAGWAVTGASHNSSASNERAAFR